MLFAASYYLRSFILWSVFYLFVQSFYLSCSQPTTDSSQSHQHFGGTQHYLQSDVKVLHFTSSAVLFFRSGIDILIFFVIKGSKSETVYEVDRDNCNVIAAKMLPDKATSLTRSMGVNQLGKVHQDLM